MIYATITLRVAHCWLTNLIRKGMAKIGNIRMYEVNREDNTITEVVTLFLDKDIDVRDIIHEVRGSRYVKKARLIRKDGNRATMEVKATECPLYTILLYDAITFRKERVKPNGDIELSMIFTRRRSLDRVLDRITHEVSDTTIKDIKIRKRAYPLSEIQENIIRTALDLGYYDYPKKITLKELGELLDLSPSYLNEVLKKAEKKIITEYFRTQDRIIIK